MENILVFQIFRDLKKYNHPFFGVVGKELPFVLRKLAVSPCNGVVLVPCRCCIYCVVLKV